MKRLSPQELRAETAADYARWMKIAREEADKLAVRDLELVDAARRAGGLQSPTAKPKPDKQKQRRALAPHETAHGSIKTPTSDAKTVRVAAMHANPMKVGDRYAHAVGRMARIIQGAGRSTTLTGSLANSEIPQLAMEFGHVWSEFMQRNPFTERTGKITLSSSGSTSGRINRFDGLSDVDASRMLARCIEDIADRSVKWLGPWFVPK